MDNPYVERSQSFLSQAHRSSAPRVIVAVRRRKIRRAESRD
jgi:hypothetical protein